VGPIRHARAWAASAAAIGGCVIAVAGCGGGGDDATSTSANATAVPGITSPGQPSGGSSSSTARSGPGAGTTPNAAPNAAPGARPFQQALAPFRACLKQHGVDLPLLGGSGALQQEYQQDPQRFRDQVERGFACIPELPPQMRAYAERFKRRFEQRNQG
jgi:hypothetical protein